MKSDNLKTGREMYTRRDAQERATRKPLDSLPPEQRAKVEEIKATLENATRHIHPQAPATSPAPGDESGHREPLRQQMVAQERTAPNLTPTDMDAGRSAADWKGPEPPDKEPEKTADSRPGQRLQYLPRRPPSWER